MRKLKRSIARHKMVKFGIQKMNKRKWGFMPGSRVPSKLPSYFAENWRRFLNAKV